MKIYLAGQPIWHFSIKEKKKRERILKMPKNRLLSFYFINLNNDIFCQFKLFKFIIKSNVIT